MNAGLIRGAAAVALLVVVGKLAGDFDKKSCSTLTTTCNNCPLVGTNQWCQLQMPNAHKTCVTSGVNDCSERLCDCGIGVIYFDQCLSMVTNLPCGPVEAGCGIGCAVGIGP